MLLKFNGDGKTHGDSVPCISSDDQVNIVSNKIKGNGDNIISNIVREEAKHSDDQLSFDLSATSDSWLNEVDVSQCLSVGKAKDCKSNDDLWLNAYLFSNVISGLVADWRASHKEINTHQKSKLLEKIVNDQRSKEKSKCRATSLNKCL